MTDDPTLTTPSADTSSLDQEVSTEFQVVADTLLGFNDSGHPAVQALHAWILERMTTLAAGGHPSPISFRLLGAFPPPSEADLQSLSPMSLDRLISWQMQLASFPDIFIRIFEAVNRISGNADHIADIIRMDTSLSAKLLKMVNSPLFGLRAPVESISRAVTLTGLDELSMLALGVSAVEYFQGIPGEYMDMKSFWMHSLACGVAARCLAANLKIYKRERFFIAGLLHDIGKLVIFRNNPQGAALCIALSRSEPCPLHLAEQRVLGYDHTDVARKLLAAWRIPEPLQDMVKHYHSPMQSDAPRDAAIIHVADIMASAMSTEMETPFPAQPLSAEAWSMAGMGLDELGQVMEEIIMVMGELTSTFLSAGDRS